VTCDFAIDKCSSMTILARVFSSSHLVQRLVNTWRMNRRDTQELDSRLAPKVLRWLTLEIWEDTSQSRRSRTRRNAMRIF
jgi:hypothetical protein